MTELEIFRLSAEACGYPVELSEDGTITWICRVRVNARSIGGREVRAGGLRWNPFTNAEQRWECMTKVIELSVTVTFGKHDRAIYAESIGVWASNCPAEEFPARALAALKARSESDLAKKE